MNDNLNFQSLVSLCGQTHEAMQRQAARSVNIGLVVRNWLFGCYIVEYQQNGADRAEYGERFIDALAEKLKERGIKGCSVTQLKLNRLFYQQRKEIRQTVSGECCNLLAENGLKIRQTVSDELSRIPQTSSAESISETLFRISPDIWQTLSAEFRLSWSHYAVLLTLDNPEERSFYEIEVAANSWSVRELERQISSSLYERLALSRDKEEIRRLAKEGQVIEKAADLIKNPLVLEFLGLEEKPAYSEEELETAIIDKLEQFLLELGKGFLFEARQKRFTFDNDHFYVDLVFYNRLLRCYVLIDLKRDKLTHQDLGQMQMYVNHFDRHVKTADEAPTVGIVLCHRKN
ncbi:MAG: PDDEXK nuclease domain-containing protein, partial [Pontiellaceae bacterium]|nr:PDDEXK nuclease domain-containing protein [Pontiellaceae bacterium]